MASCFFTKENKQFNKDMVIYLENLSSLCKKTTPPPQKKLNYSLLPHRKINTEYIIDINVNYKSIQLLEENKGEKSLWPRLYKEFLDFTPKVQSIMGKKINKYGFIKI